MALFRRQESFLHFALPFTGAASLRYKVHCDTETLQQQYSRLTSARTDTDTFHTAESTTLYLLPIACQCGPGSVVGVATGYGLDGPGIESR